MSDRLQLRRRSGYARLGRRPGAEHGGLRDSRLARLGAIVVRRKNRSKIDFFHRSLYRQGAKDIWTRFAGGLGGGGNTAAATGGWGCILWRVPRNTTTHQSVSPTDSTGEVVDTTNNSGGVADTIVQFTDDNDSGGSDDNNNNGEPEDSRLRSPSFFQSQQPKQ